MDSAGNVYVADAGNNRIQKFDANGIFITKWGSGGSENGQFSSPQGIAVDTAGNVYVVDMWNNRIQKFTSAGTFIKKWGGDGPEYSGSGSGNGQFNGPGDIAVDNAGNVYVADTGNNRIQKFTSDGVFINQWLMTSPGGWPTEPDGVAVDSAGNVYVVDVSYDQRVLKFSSTGTFITQFGSDYIHDSAIIYHTSVEVDSAGNIYLGESNWIQKFMSTGTFIKNWDSKCSQNYPNDGDVAVNSAGKVYVVDAGNNRIQIFVPATPPPSLIPSFIATPTTGTAPLTVQFTDTTTGSPTSWYWNFGDGYASSGQNPRHLYNAAGTYSVTLTATNAAAGSKSITKTGYITVTATQPTPVAGAYKPHNLPARIEAEDYDNGGAGTAYYDSTAGNLGNAYRLNQDVDVEAGATGYNVGYITDGEWLTYTVDVATAGTYTAFFNVASWMDGRSIAVSVDNTPAGTVQVSNTGDSSVWVAIPMNLNLPAGTHVLKLAFTGNKQNLDYIDFPSGPQPTNIVPAFTATPTTGTAPLTVQFTDTTTGGPTSWYWNFGDGYASSAQNPSHLYSSAGTYTVTLTANNAAAGSKSITKTGYITVSAPLTPGFTATPTTGTAPLTVQFTDTTTGNPTSWYWNFGDGYASSAQNPSHLYSAAGTYSVTLTANNAASGSKSITKTGYITISSPVQPIQAAFTVNTQSIQAGQSVAGTDASTGSPTSWTWNFGDGTTASTQNVNHIYNAAGSYTLSLTVTKGSQTSTTSKTITVTAGSSYNGPHIIPGILQVADYDLGGESVAYHDTTPSNQGGVYRSDDVDIEYSTGVNGTVVDDMMPGEWLAYTVTVSTADVYDATFKVSSATDGNSFTVTSDESPIMAVVVPNTGSYDTYTTVKMPVWLLAGKHQIKVVTTGHHNLATMEFRQHTDAPLPTPTLTQTLVGPSVTQVPSSGNAPRDLNSDGLYEDINGNGALDFNDVVTYFNQMDWIASNEPVTAFDFNRNGQIDFNDIVILFNEM